MLLRIYIKFILLIASIVATFGYFAPWLISSDDSLLVTMGILLLVVALPGTAVMTSDILKSIDKYKKEK